jgi:hypothetical protein
MAGSESSSVVEASHYKNLRANMYGPRNPTDINGMLHGRVTLPSRGEAIGSNL